MHQGLKLLVVAFEVKLQVRAVGIDGGGVQGGFFNRAGIELLVQHAGLDDGGKRRRRHRVGCENTEIEIYSTLKVHGVAGSQDALLEALVVANSRSEEH